MGLQMNEINFSNINLMAARLFKRTSGLMVLAFLLMGMTQGNCEDASSKEYQVKAVFLLNFAKYVDWPATAFTNSAEPITIGVLGTDPFGDNLQHDVADKMVNGRPFAIKHLAADSDLNGCQILFVSDSESSRMGEILSKAGALPILTIGEDEEFSQNGGIINFVLKDGKVRLEIDLTTANKTGLKISSRLLAVADVVKGRTN
jgi:hypothetical protein